MKINEKEVGVGPFKKYFLLVTNHYETRKAKTSFF